MKNFIKQLKTNNLLELLLLIIISYILIKYFISIINYIYTNFNNNNLNELSHMSNSVSSSNDESKSSHIILNNIQDPTNPWIIPQGLGSIGLAALNIQKKKKTNFS